MGRIYGSMEELIGHTPLLRLSRLAESQEAGAEILAKLEGMNPGGSAKDRAALSMITDACETGKMDFSGLIIEPTSGNTGIGLCAVAAARGYQAMIVMPDNMSRERQQLMKAYGADVVLTDGKKGMAGATEKAKELAKEFPWSWIPEQFENPANPAAHYASTGPEIWEDTDGNVDILVAGVGTGGTITGTGRYLKEKNPNIRVVAVEPENSPVLSGGKPGPHGLQGIGAGFVPRALDPEIYDEVIRVKEEEAYQAARLLGKTEGVLSGISGGAALHAAILLAKRPENRGKRIVVILPDGGERYLSTPLYTQE